MQRVSCRAAARVLRSGSKRRIPCFCRLNKQVSESFEFKIAEDRVGLNPSYEGAAPHFCGDYPKVRRWNWNGEHKAEVPSETNCGALRAWAQGHASGIHDGL